MYDINAIMDCAVEEPDPPKPEDLFGRIPPFCGAPIRSFRLPADEDLYLELEVPGHGWRELVWCFSHWARVYWLPGTPHRIWVLCCRYLPTKQGYAFYAVPLTLPAGREQEQDPSQTRLGQVRIMNFDECVDFLVELQQEMAKVNGKVRPRHSTKGIRRLRAAWVGPLTPDQEARLTALASVFRADLRAITTAQKVKHFRKKLAEARASEAVFLWEVRCENLGGIVRSAFPTLEACQEWEWDDMVLAFQFWLQQNAEGLSNVDNEQGLAPEIVQKRLGQMKVLCISPQRRPDIKDALQRGGFPTDEVDLFFYEEKIEFGENSNLMETLEDRADTFHYLLYVWEGLRHTSSAVEKKFGKRLFKGRTARSVAEQFRLFVLTHQNDD